MNISTMCKHLAMAFVVVATGVMAMAQQSPIAVKWEMINNKAGDGFYSCRFVVKNVSTAPLQRDWVLFQPIFAQGENSPNLPCRHQGNFNHLLSCGAQQPLQDTCPRRHNGCRHAHAGQHGQHLLCATRWPCGARQCFATTIAGENRDSRVVTPRPMGYA